MVDRPGPGAPRALRLIASWLIRSRDARFILHDLDEIFARDVARGVGSWRARARYVHNALGSAASVWRADAHRLRVPALPGVSWLDVKLGVRMLGKHPAFTVVAGFALALGIPVGLMPLQIFHAFNAPMPFDEGERIVGLRNYDISIQDPAPRAIHDFETWRAELTSVSAMAAVSSARHNLVDEDGRAEPVRGSEMSAVGFDILRVSPVLGRRLLPADELPGAPPVVVLGYDLWQTRFGGAADVVGRTVQVGATRRTVVGVMPEGFLFPYRDNLWMPWQARALDYEWGQGPALWMLARLRDGVTAAQARAELETVARRTAAAHPETHEHLRAEVVPFTWTVTGMEARFNLEFFQIQAMALLLLAVACGNIGTLMLARAATRSSEIAVRTALGASRARIVGQLFVESLVLALLAAAAGLVISSVVVDRSTLLTRSMPFWFDLGVGSSTVVWAGALAAFSAAIAGVIPALKATGPSVQRNLQRLAPGGGGVRFGAISSGLIVVEVALSVCFLSVVGVLGWKGILSRELDPGIPTAEYLTASLRMPYAPPGDAPEAERRAFAERFGRIQEEIARRLAAEPGVRGVVFADRLPGMDHPSRRIEIEGEDLPLNAAGTAHTATVGPDYFEALGRPVLAGRGFDSGDLASERRAVLVNESFVARLLHDQNPIGRRVRYAARPGDEPGPWFDIVGVVSDLGMEALDPALAAGIYHVAPPGEIHPLRLGVHVGRDPESFAPTLRALAAAVDPTLTVPDAVALDEAFSEARWGAVWGAFLFAVLALIAIALSTAGLYALMSFTVSQRTREIGIRTALGADPRRIVGSILRRASIQIVAGVLLGSGLGAALLVDLSNDPMFHTPQWPSVLAATAAFMVLVGLLACAGPTRRGLRVLPSDALREG